MNLCEPITHFCEFCGFCERICAGGKKKCPIHEDGAFCITFSAKPRK